MHTLLTTREMGEADRLTIAAGTPGRTLMQAAGEAVAEAAGRLHTRGAGTHVLVLCGPGNNGGDGFDAARRLREDGYDVRVALLGACDALKGDAALAAREWAEPAEDAAQVDLAGADVVIDALFGAGLSRDLDGAAKTLVERVNAWRRESGRVVIAVDVPSGIDGNSGAVRGAAIEADRTITFFRRKPGHLLLPGRVHCGATSVADIGITSKVLHAIAPRTFENVPDLWSEQLPVPAIAGHKYSRGHAVVVSGGLETTGAARLAARGALRAGAGLVTVATPSDALAVHAAALTAIMTRVADGTNGLASLLADARKNSVVMGPGLGIGEATCNLVRVALSPAKEPRAEHFRACVLDADALTSFASHADELFALIATAPGPVVLTPHAGEFTRLFGAPGVSKLDAARQAARRSGAIIVFKGPDTVVASPDGRASIAANAPAWLATAGSGDVLAGIAGGLLAQAMPAFEAVCAAVWMHGAAAAHFGPGLIAEDIPECLPTVWRSLV